MRPRPLVVLTATVLLAVSCGGGSGGGDDDSKSQESFRGIAPREGVTSLVLSGTLDLEVEGAVEARWSGQTPLNVLTSVGLGQPEGLWVLTVGILPEHILEVGDGLKIRPAFDVVGYSGAGDYTITPPRPGGLSEEELDQVNSGETPIDQSGIFKSGTVFVVATSREDGSEGVSNFGLEEPCSLRVGDMGLEGSIECPRATASAGEISYTWSWTADPDKLIEDLTAGIGTPATDATGTTQAGKAEGGGPTGGSGASGTEGSIGSEGTTGSGGAPGTDGGGRYGLRAPYRLDVEVTPDDCAVRGTAAVVRVRTIPDATLTLAVAYSDAQPHGNVTVGETGPTGSFNWAFTVTGTAPLGQADLLVNVTPKEGSPETESGGGIVKAFEVKSLC